MSNLSDKLQARLAVMKEDFAKQLPERFQEISRVSAEIKAEPSVEGLDRLRLLVHKLAGSGATFDFENLSVAAKVAEEYIDEFLKESRIPNSDELLRIDTLLHPIMIECCDDSEVEELETIDEDNNNQPKSIDTSNVKSIIYLVDKDGVVAQDVAEQIRLYGYKVKEVASIKEIEDALEEGYKQLLLIHTHHVCTNEEMPKKLMSLKKYYGTALGIIFVSENDRFETRLQAVRSGGDAFFLLPLDITRLVDRIDALTSRVETTPYHVLIVDDDHEQVAYYAFLLQQAGMITSVASDPMQVLEVLVEAKPELILMDMYMPACSGMELAYLIRQHEAFMSIPILFLSFENNKEKQMEAICQGADDFLTKPIKPDHLVSIVTTRAERNRDLRYFMERDSLTGLLNHSNLKEMINRELLRAMRQEVQLCFAMIDLDKFKIVNDTYGHLTGDRVLKSMARLLQDRLRRTDIIGRYGGEEFGIILLNTSEEHALMIMDEIRERFSHIKHQSDDREFLVTFSCGIASYPNIKEPSELAVAADSALYLAKSTGRNKVLVYDKQQNKTRENKTPSSKAKKGTPKRK